MNRGKGVRLAVVLLLLAVVPMLAHAYEENIREGIFLVRPENEYVADTAIPLYLENEDLVFFACLESQDVPLRLSVLCLDNNEFEDVAARKWGPQNCYIGSTTLEQFDCTRAVVQADYVSEGENLKLSQQIRINKFAQSLNRVIETQFTDGGWETPLDTAFGLLVVSSFPEIFPERVDKALDYLKVNRDEVQKCWPKDGCRISTTAAILFLLDKAGHDDLRIQNDGRLYLEKTQAYLSGEDWELSIGDHALNLNNTINTSCVYEYGSTLTTYTLGRYPTERVLTVAPSYGGQIGLACTENIYVNLYNEYGERLLSYQGDNFTYTIPQPCWTRNNENLSCDTRATLLAANSPLSSQRRSSATSYLASLLTDHRTAGKQLGEDPNILDDSLYVHLGVSGATDVRTTMLYEQNNSGAWTFHDTRYEDSWFELDEEEKSSMAAEINDTVTRNIVGTGFSVMALLQSGFTREDEVILDAERWVSLNEDATSLNYSDQDLTVEANAAAYQGNRSQILNDTKRNALSFYVLKNNARPLLLAKPRVLLLNEEEAQVDIVNPTVFELDELTYELSDSLKKYVSVEEKDYVDAYSFRRITVRQSASPIQNEIGYLRIMQGSNEYLKLPIIVDTRPTLEVSLPEQLTVFGSTALLPFTVERSAHNFTCSLEWETEGISGTAPFDISKADGDTYEYPVRFAQLQTEDKVYEGTLTCSANEVTYVVPFGSQITRFSSKPLRVLPNYLSFEDTQPQEIAVQNMLDESITVAIALLELDGYIAVSDTVLSLLPGEQRNVTVQVIPPAGEGYNTTNSLVFTTFTVEERVLLDASILAPQDRFPATSLFIAGGVLIVVLGAGGYLGYRRRAGIKKWYAEHFHKEDIRRQVLEQVQRLERDQELLAIKNLSRILKMQGAGDGDVRKRLLQEGYTQADVDAALTGAGADAKAPGAAQ